MGRCEYKNGNGGGYIKHLINKLGLKNNFMIWDNFIPMDIFHTMIKNSDYILPLIHEGEKSGNLYDYQISGSYNLAVGYKKPILIEKNYHSNFNDYETVIYDKEFLMKTINSLDNINLNSSYNHEKWTFDYQRKTYLDSLDLTLSNTK